MRLRYTGGQVASAQRDYEVVFYTSPSLYDGRFANNGWLQELPDPMSRITWDNAAVMSPKTAAAIGVESDDIVSVEVGGAKIDLSVFILVGQPENTVALALGYGHTHLGQIANGVGQNTSCGTCGHQQPAMNCKALSVH